MSPSVERFITEAEELLDVNSAELAKVLRTGHRAVIIEADEWRPLADHVLELVQLALERSRAKKGTKR